ncbi:YdcF family protein [Aureispira anguillae]|uniref:YdcF family protein n=1 Tax=Aureispira anguillae TaxID=2864201 RepID=A0A915YCV0_9BACT|nr:YdcF family protein [Aureispira anguillae]BDS10748.1 YdcF family protein [Aureispira anguillae]
MDQLTNIMKKIAILGVFAILLTSCVSRSAERSFNRYAEQQPYDAIIVPGVPFEDGEWSNIMKMRVHWAVYLYKNNYTQNIIFSGSSVYSPYVEAKIMALYAEQLGVPKAHIYTEERAEHSSENLYYSYRVAKENGLQKVALATDPFQGSFLKGFARKIKLDIGFLPVIFDKLKTLDTYTPKIDPSSAYVEDFVSITKRENALVRFQGTMGKHIQYEAEDNPKLKRKKAKK